MKTLSIAILCAIVLGVAMLWIPAGPALPPGLTFAQSNQNNFPGTGPGTGSVTTLSVATANGVSGSVATATTTPVITLTLGAITPSSVAATGALSTGANGGAAGVVNWLGSTSGTANCTAPAVAGTTTNPVTCTNVFNVALGDSTHAAYGFGGGAAANLGMWLTGASGLELTGASNGEIAFNNSTTTQWRILGNSAGQLQPGTANAQAIGDATHAVGGMYSTYLQVAGTKFTTNAGCGESAGTTTGGATTGKFTTAGSTSCTSVVTFGNSATATNGWACTAHDLTTSADYNNPHVSSNATTATIISGTIVASDVIEFACVGY